MAPFESDSHQPWREYYALRNWARLSLSAITVCLYLLLVKPPNTLLHRLNNLSEPLKLTVVFVGLGLATIAFAAPVLKWAEWKCPRCGNKFVQGKMEFGILFILPLIGWRLVLGMGRCAMCRLPCGAGLEEANFDNR